MVRLADVGIEICTCFRELVPLDCYWERDGGGRGLVRLLRLK